MVCFKCGFECDDDEEYQKVGGNDLCRECYYESLEDYDEERDGPVEVHEPGRTVSKKTIHVSERLEKQINVSDKNFSSRLLQQLDIASTLMCCAGEALLGTLSGRDFVEIRNCSENSTWHKRVTAIEMIGFSKSLIGHVSNVVRGKMLELSDVELLALAYIICNKPIEGYLRPLQYFFDDRGGGSGINPATIKPLTKTELLRQEYDRKREEKLRLKAEKVAKIEADKKLRREIHDRDLERVQSLQGGKNSDNLNKWSNNLDEENLDF